MKRMTWWLAVSLFAGLLVATLVGVADAEALDVGGVRFSLGQVLTILAAGVAWGEMRMRVTNIEKRLDRKDKEEA